MEHRRQRPACAAPPAPAGARSTLRAAPLIAVSALVAIALTAFAPAGANASRTATATSPIATAAGEPVTAAQAEGTPAPPAPTSPAATTPTFSVPASAATPPPASLTGWIPNDQVGSLPWTALQWNFVGRWGVNAPQAWQVLRRRSMARAGGRGVTVAVVDSGIAYRDRSPYRRSPDIDPARILPGYDFVDLDRFPDDESGHGTHVASTIAAATGNATGLTGLAYNAKILPIRVLDEKDSGDVLAIARGIRYAIRRKVDLINLSVDFPVSTAAADIPEVVDAVEAARRAGILVIASSGNDGARTIPYPARSPAVLAVGATTVRGCRSQFPREGFSNGGPQLALVAPGGGSDRDDGDSPRCKPRLPGPPITQITLLRQEDPTTLGIPLDFVGTSMAAAHVTGIAALVLASGILGPDPSPDLLAAYLVRATRDLGPPGRDERYGAGLIDASMAVSRTGAGARVQSARRAVAAAARKGQRSLPIR